MTTKYMSVAITRDDPYSPAGARAVRVTLLDAENRLIKYSSGDIIQVQDMERLHDTEAEAVMAGAAKLQSEADKLAALAADAREKAAKLAAAGRVEVCST